MPVLANSDVQTQVGWKSIAAQGTRRLLRAARHLASGIDYRAGLPLERSFHQRSRSAHVGAQRRPKKQRGRGIVAERSSQRVTDGEPRSVPRLPNLVRNRSKAVIHQRTVSCTPLLHVDAASPNSRATERVPVHRERVAGRRRHQDQPVQRARVCAKAGANTQRGIRLQRQAHLIGPRDRGVVSIDGQRKLRTEHVVDQRFRVAKRMNPLMRAGIPGAHGKERRERPGERQARGQHRMSGSHEAAAQPEEDMEPTRESSLMLGEGREDLRRPARLQERTILPGAHTERPHYIECVLRFGADPEARTTSPTVGRHRQSRAVRASSTRQAQWSVRGPPVRVHIQVRSPNLSVDRRALAQRLPPADPDGSTLPLE